MTLNKVGVRTRILLNRVRNLPIAVQIAGLFLALVLMILVLRPIGAFAIPAKSQAIQACARLIEAVRGYDLGRFRGPGELTEVLERSLSHARYASWFHPKWSALGDSLAALRDKAQNGKLPGPSGQVDAARASIECGKTGATNLDPFQD